MPKAIPFQPPSRTKRRARVFALSIPPFEQEEALVFGLLAHDGASAVATERTLAHLITALENIALEGSRVASASAWFAEYLQRVRRPLDDASTHADRRVDCCLGVAYRTGSRTAISISSTGRISATVTTSDGRGHSMVTTLIAGERVTRGAAFHHVLEGTIGPQDALCITTTDERDGLPTDALRDACDGRSIAHGIATVRERLQGESLPWIALCITEAHPEKVRSQTSMTSFLRTAASTEQFLTPKLGPTLKRYLADLTATRKLLRRTRRGKIAHRSRILPLAVHGIRLSFYTIAVAVKSVGVLAFDGLKLMGIWCARAVRAAQHAFQMAQSMDREHLRSLGSPAALQARIRSFGRRQLAQYRQLTPTSRTLLILTITFGFLFLTSTAHLWRRRIVEADVQAYNTAIARIEELRSIAEARMLFGSLSEARMALRTASEQLVGLPQNSRARRARVELLTAEIDAALDRARLLTRLQDPVRVTDAARMGWSTISDIAVAGSSLVATAPDRTIAVVHTRTGEARPLPRASAAIDLAPATTHSLDDRTIVLLEPSARLEFIDLQTGAATTGSIDAPPGDTQSASLFQKRLYLLQADGAITRHQRTAGGFTRGSAWLDPLRDASPARTLLVQGTAFIGFSDGRIRMFVAGRERSTDLHANVDPPLERAPLLAGLPESDVLHLGDAVQGRVITIADDGRLIGQIQSNAFRNMSRITIDPSGESLYILANDVVYVVAVPRR